MTKRDFIEATKYWLGEGESMIGSMHPDERDERKEDVQAITKRILKILQNMPAGEFRDLQELNYDY